MEKQHAKKFLKKYITVTGGPAAVDALDDENKGCKAKEFVKKYFTVVGGPEAIDAAAEPEPKYLTMILPEDSPETQISINKNGTPIGTNIQYRVNNEDWTDWNFATSQPISAVANDVIQWKGNNPKGLSKGRSNNIYFRIPNEVHLSGNVMSLIDGVGKTKVIPCSGCFYSLFGGTKIKTISEDFLPATTLTESCYAYMFAGSSIVKALEILPATTLASNCYEGMFIECKSLVDAPVLPADTLADSCYKNMFQNCSSLVTAPALPATTLANECYNLMFCGCKSLVTAPALPATELAPYCYRWMFSGCSSLVNVPEILPATALAEFCYEYMFNGCSSLVSAPALPATALVEGCYGEMFSRCSKLQHVTCLATYIPIYYCTGEWLSGVASTGTFNQAVGAAWSTGTSGIPYGWKINKTEKPENPEPESKYLTMTVPEGSPTTQIIISKYGTPVGTNIQYRLNYNNWIDFNVMSPKPIPVGAGGVIQFKGVNPTGLSQDYNNYIRFVIQNEVNLSGNVMSLIDGVGDRKDIPCYYCFYSLVSGARIKTVTEDFLPATTLKNSCYKGMFNGSSLETAPALTATTLADNCYERMFSGCSSLETAPALTATTLVNGCYSGMFAGCSKLQNVTCLATDISAENCTSTWLGGVASTGTFVKASGFNGWTTGVNGIPEGWTEVEK